MGIIDTKAAGGVGMARMIVRAPSFLPLDRAAALRPAYNEYPELYPLDPSFPQPGRRGGSRAPLSSGGAAEGEAATKAGKSVVPPSLYPEPRPRGGEPGSGVIGDASAVPALGGGCVEVGDTLRNSPQVPAAGGIRSFASRRIARPFIITHISYWSSNAVPSAVTDVALKLFLADDGVQTLTALVSSGTPLDFFEGGSQLEPHSVREEHYPLTLVNDAGKFFKIEWQNAGAAAVETYLTISWRYL